MFYFVFKLFFFDPKIPLNFTSVVIYAHPIKKDTTKLKTLTRMGYLINGSFRGLFSSMSLSNGMSVVDLSK